MKLSSIFSNHMVLQRNKPIRIWGEGNGEITVTLNNQTQTATSEDGKWTVTLSPEAAGGPFELTVCDLKEKIVLSDVMIGDVWLAAGQSNMENVTFLTRDGVEDAEKLGNNNNIRYFTVPRRTRKDEIIHRWHFEDVLSEDKTWEVSTTNSALHFSAIGFWFAGLLEKEENVPVGIISCNFGGTRIETWIEYSRVMSEPNLQYAAKPHSDIMQSLDFDSYLEEHNKFLNSIEDFCKKYNAFEISQKMGVEQFAVNPGLPWFGTSPMGPYSENFPGVLFENMVMSIAPFSLSGVLWYQGESNGGVAEHYCDAFSVMVKNWREVFKDELPFLTVQIAPYNNYNRENARAILNKEQLLATQKNDKVYIVTTGDIGEAYNIHPINKKDIAKRLFAAAQSVVYGKGNEYCGPIAISAKLSANNKIIIEFNHAKCGLIVDNSINDVQICDKSGVFITVNAHSNNKVLIVDCGDVSAPKAVRMGYTNYTQTNLFNVEGFPAMPFCLEL